MKSFCRKFFGSIALIIVFSVGIKAADVPGAIKYQAVLRDVNGKALSGKENINLRISLRLDDPVSGQIAYSEEHRAVKANAFGIVNLEIGRGTVTSGTTLNNVAWDGHSVYIQIEVETDGSGFTNMGTSELLTVPYAFMAGNVGGAQLYDNLSDNILPKYNAANHTLVNSGLSQTGRALKVDASSVTFLNSAEGNNGYTFPSAAGKSGQALVLTDNMGTLGWGNVEGGSGSGLSGNLDEAEDGKLIYWNYPSAKLAAAPITYRYSSDKGFSLTGDMEMSGNLTVGGTIRTHATGMEINGTVSGLNNLLTNDMGDAQIWIGNTQKPLIPRALSGHVKMDNTGKTTLNLAWKGLRLIPGNTALGAPDTVALAASLGDSLWLRNAEDNLYSYNKGKALDQTKVGIGTSSPQSMLHVQGGDVLFTAPDNTAGNTPRFVWYPELAALRAGALSSLHTTDWDKSNVGRYSVAFGLDAQAAGDHGIAIGNGSTVMAPNSMALGISASVATTPNNKGESLAIGVNSQTTNDYAVAIGRGAVANGESSVVLGKQSRAIGDNAIALGNDLIVRQNAVGVGRNNNVDGEGSVVLGVENENFADNVVVIGGGNNIAGQGSIVIGKGIEIPNGVRSMVVGELQENGTGGLPYAVNGPIVFGSVDMINGVSDDLIALGRSITEGSEEEGAVTMLGSDLTNGGNDPSEPGYPYITMLGDAYFSVSDKMENLNNPAAKPIFMFGSAGLFTERSEFVAFQIDNDGTSHFNGNLDVVGEVSSIYGVCQSSDYRLKTDIEPRIWGASLLDSLTPVTFRYKTDRKNRTQYGFIAQEVQRYFPELVSADAKGMLSMNYTGLIPVLWQINQQLNRRVETLERKVAEQQRLLDEKDMKIIELESTLKAEIEAIKVKIGM